MPEPSAPRGPRRLVLTQVTRADRPDRCLGRPSATQPRRTERPDGVSGGRRRGSGKLGGRPPEYFGYSDSKPSSLKLCSTARTRSSDVNATLAIWATSMPWADSSTICARRHVTTDPELRRTMRSSRWPSSLLISRTRTLSAIPRSKQTPPPNRWTRQANVAGYGTSWVTDDDIAHMAAHYRPGATPPHAAGVIDLQPVSVDSVEVA